MSAFAIFDLVLIVATVSVLVMLWGGAADGTLAGLTGLFRGVQIGSFTFSLLDFLVAVAFFAAIMLATRLLQRGLERHFLPNVVRETR